VKEIPNKGRQIGSVEVPNALRQVIGETSAIDGRAAALELARTFEVGPSSVSAYNKGATSTASYSDRPNLPHINQAKERISKKARTRLINALNHITNDKLESAKVGELATVARNMSAIVKDMEPESEKGGKNTMNQPTFVFYSPQVRKEDTFDVIKLPE
jgi:hypothetical protein